MKVPPVQFVFGRRIKTLGEHVAIVNHRARVRSTKIIE
jgi:hypothetical protein